MTSTKLLTKIEGFNIHLFFTNWF